jgi:hypothetical protein
MQIGSGHSPLSLAVLKALGSQPASAAAAGAAKAETSIAAPKGTPQGPDKSAAKAAVLARPTGPATSQGATDPASDLGVARNIPRGSFVDLRV